jgi:hypothetical protein
MSEDLKVTICPNCKEERSGSFCNICGNELDLKRLDILELLKEFSKRLFLLESIYWQTFLTQLKHPGIVSVAYIRGNRKKYANPLSYMISLTIVTWIIHTLLVYLGPKTSSLELMLETSFLNEYIGFNTNNLPPRASEIFNLIFGKAVVTNIICVMPIAIYMRLLFRNAGYNTAEHIVIAMYGLTFANILTVVFSIVLLPFILFQWINISNVASLFNFSILILSSIYGARKMYKIGIKSVTWRVITVIFLSTITLFFILFVMMLLLLKITGETANTI